MWIILESAPPGWLLIKVTRWRPCNSRRRNNVPTDCLRLPLSVSVCLSFDLVFSRLARYHIRLRLFSNLIPADSHSHLRSWMCPLRRSPRGLDRRRGPLTRHVSNVFSPAVCFSSSLDLSACYSHAVTRWIPCRIRSVLLNKHLCIHWINGYIHYSYLFDVFIDDL